MHLGRHSECICLSALILPLTVVSRSLKSPRFPATSPSRRALVPFEHGTLCDAGSESGRATPTTALVDASDRFEFSIRSRFDESIRDFVVTAIDVDEVDDTHRWNIYVNDVLVANGGCHVAVAEGDNVRFVDYSGAQISSFTPLLDYGLASISGQAFSANMAAGVSFLWGFFCAARHNHRNPNRIGHWQRALVCPPSWECHISSLAQALRGRLGWKRRRTRKEYLGRIEFRVWVSRFRLRLHWPSEHTNHLITVLHAGQPTYGDRDREVGLAHRVSTNRLGGL